MWTHFFKKNLNLGSLSYGGLTSSSKLIYSRLDFNYVKPTLISFYLHSFYKKYFNIWLPLWNTKLKKIETSIIAENNSIFDKTNRNFKCNQ